MANSNGNDGQRDIRRFTEALGQLRPEFDVEPLSDMTLDNVAFHDFAFYEYLLPTAEGYGRSIRHALSAKGLEYLDDLEQRKVSGEQLDFLADFLVLLENIIRDAVYTIALPLGTQDSARETFLQDAIDTLYTRYPFYIQELFALYESIGDERRSFLDDLYEQVRLRARIDILSGHPYDWATWHFFAAGGIDYSGGQPATVGKGVFLQKWRD